MVKEEQTLEEFTKALAAKGINVVLRQSSQGSIYGLTDVNFRSKCVFNGSDLGKESLMIEMEQTVQHTV